VHTLHAFLTDHIPYTFRITIANNASTDGTLGVAASLATRYPAVEVFHLDAKGRGRALRAAWGASDADVVAYLDVDLSTDLGGLLPLVAPLVSGHSDIAIGTRLSRASRVVATAVADLKGVTRMRRTLRDGTLPTGRLRARPARAPLAERELQLVG
jgi:glycosyltransferase involved in cell wall biosynthesis